MAAQGRRQRTDRFQPAHLIERYAQDRLLHAKKRAITASTPKERQRAEAWVQRWGRLVRGFFDPSRRR